MKVNIRYVSKTVDVGTLDYIDAGWIGYDFVKYNRDLVEEGWSLHYYRHSEARFNLPSTILVKGLTELAERIREGTPCSHSCIHHQVKE